MKMFYRIVLVLVLLLCIRGGINAATTVDFVNCRRLSDDQIVLLASLQGLTARSGHTFFLETGGSEVWRKNLRRNKVRFQEQSYEAIIGKYIHHTSGYVLCDAGNLVVGVTASIPHNAVVVTPATEAMVKDKGLELKLDVRGKDESWLLEYVEKNRTHYNRNGIVQPAGKKPYSMADYAVLKKHIVINSKDNPELTRKFYSLIESNSPRLGWGSPFGDEKRDVGLAAEYGLYTLPTGNTTNVSFFHVLRKWKPATKPVRSLIVPTPDASKHYVMIMMSDGDNLNWHYSGLVGRAKFKDHPAAPLYPISWMYPPLMKDISPVVHDYYMSTLPVTHSMLGGVSGAGYTFPSKHKNLDSFAALTNQKMKESGMSSLVIMDFLDFRTKQKELLSDMIKKMPDVKGLFYMDYGNYAKWKGDVYFIGDKPVISFKYRLWKPMDPLEKIAEQINQAPRNPRSIDGYSAVVVHAWSYDMGEVERFIKMLNPDVELINAEQMIEMIVKNTFVPTNNL